MKHFKFSAVALALVATLASCSENGNDEPGGGGSGSSTLKLDRLDLSGAKALTLVGGDQSTRADGNGGNTLFKMDADGNLSAVVLYVKEEEDGTQTTTRSDISVHPREIHNLSGAYTYMRDCSFSDESGNGVYIPIPDDSFYFNILVKNSTGKIYYVPDAAQRYFPWNDTYTDQSAIDKNGNLYLRDGYGHLVKATFTAYEATVTGYGPEDLGWSGDMHVLDNGTICFCEGGGGWSHSLQSLSFVYPNGGYEHLDGSNSDYHCGTGPMKDEYTYLYNGKEIVALMFPMTNFDSEWKYEDDGYHYNEYYKSDEVSVSIVKVNVGTMYGGIGYSAPIATITGKNDVMKTDYLRHPAGDWTDLMRESSGGLALSETDDYYFVENVLAYNKRSGQWRDLKKEGISDHLLLPSSENVYNGRIWQVYIDCADWFDIETFTYGRVNFPDFSAYTGISDVWDIPHGKLMRTMLSPMDGKKYIFTIDIETGQYQSAEVTTQANIITLIPLN